MEDVLPDKKISIEQSDDENTSDKPYKTPPSIPFYQQNKGLLGGE
jgi:hypothetical protein